MKKKKTKLLLFPQKSPLNPRTKVVYSPFRLQAHSSGKSRILCIMFSRLRTCPRGAPHFSCARIHRRPCGLKKGNGKVFQENNLGVIIKKPI